MPQVAMPLFAQPGLMSAAKIVDAWKSLFPDGPALKRGATKDGVTAYKIDRREVFVAFISAPVPVDEVLVALQSSWMWPGPDDPVRTHRAHAIVTGMAEDEDEVEAALDVARVSAALLKAGDGVALYWGSARQVHTVDVAVSLAAEIDVPVQLWVGITISGPSPEGLVSAATHGLEAFGLQELEVRGSKRKPEALREMLIGIAGYVLDEGPVLEHGQTFGPTADVRWTISHEPSQLVPGRDAIVLGIP